MPDIFPIELINTLTLTIPSLSTNCGNQNTNNSSLETSDFTLGPCNSCSNIFSILEHTKLVHFQN